MLEKEREQQEEKMHREEQEKLNCQEEERLQQPEQEEKGERQVQQEPFVPVRSRLSWLLTVSYFPTGAI